MTTAIVNAMTTGAMHRNPVWTSRKTDGIPMGGLLRETDMICDMTTAWTTVIAQIIGWMTGIARAKRIAWMIISRLYTEVMK